MEHVIELIEINIHDWTHGLGHLAAHLMPTSVTIRRRPAGSEGGLLRSGRGRMPVMSLQSEGSQRSFCDWRSVCLHQRCFTRTLKIWIGGGLRAFILSWDWTGSKALSPTSRLPYGPVLMVAAPQSHASPHTPPQHLWHHPSPGLRTLMLH